MKKIISTLALVAVMFTASAQMTDHIHNFQFNLGGAGNSLLYAPTYGDFHWGAGGLFEAQYQLMLNHYIGFGVGVQVSDMGGNTEYNIDFTDHNIMLPGAIYAANVTTNLYNWREKQRVLAINVPVELMLRLPLGVRCALQAGVGISVDFPVYGKYYVSDGNYKRTAYMERTNVNYADMDDHLLGSYSADQKGKLDLLKTPTIGYLADLGVVINTSKNMGVYLGIYGEINNHNINAATDEKTQLFSYDNLEQNYNYCGTFASNLVEDVYMIQTGIKVGLRFGACKSVDWKNDESAALAESQRKADSAAAAQAAIEAQRVAAEKAAREAAVAAAKAEAEARAKAQADSLAAAHAAELAKAKAAAEAAEQQRAQAEEAAAKAKAQAEADRLKAEQEAAAAKAEAEAKARAEQKAREEVSFVAGFSDTAYFETAKDTPIFGQLNENSWNNLKDIMASHSDVKVTVEGHADNVGSASSNLALSKRRAETIKQMLVDKGIPANRIKVIARGETHPIASNSTEEGRAKNRCIILTIGK